MKTLFHAAVIKYLINGCKRALQCPHEWWWQMSSVEQIAGGSRVRHMGGGENYAKIEERQTMGTCNDGRTLSKKHFAMNHCKNLFPLRSEEGEWALTLIIWNIFSEYFWLNLLSSFIGCYCYSTVERWNQVGLDGAEPPPPILWPMVTLSKNNRKKIKGKTDI